MCFTWRWWWMGRGSTGIAWGSRSRSRFPWFFLATLATFRNLSLWILRFPGPECDWRWRVWAQVGGGEVKQKLQCDRKPGELEVEQDSGLPRARHPRRHLAGPSLSWIWWRRWSTWCRWWWCLKKRNFGDVESETLRYSLSDWRIFSEEWEKWRQLWFSDFQILALTSFLWFSPINVFHWTCHFNHFHQFSSNSIHALFSILPILVCLRGGVSFFYQIQSYMILAMLCSVKNGIRDACIKMSKL